MLQQRLEVPSEGGAPLQLLQPQSQPLAQVLALALAAPHKGQGSSQRREQQDAEEEDMAASIGVRLLQGEAVLEREGKRVTLRGGSGQLVRAPTVTQALGIVEQQGKRLGQGAGAESGAAGIKSGEDVPSSGTLPVRQDMAWLLSLPSAYLSTASPALFSPAAQPSTVLLRAAASLGISLTPAQWQVCRAEEASEARAAQMAYEGTIADRVLEAGREASMAADESDAGTAAAAAAAAPAAAVAVPALVPGQRVLGGRGRRLGRRRGTSEDSGLLVGEGGALAWDGSKPFPFASDSAVGEEEEEGGEAKLPVDSAKNYARRAAARFS